VSVHALSWVFRHSDATLGRRLVLLVLADHASADGTGSYPSVATIAEEARLSTRAVQYALRQLEADGAIAKAGVAARGMTNWTVVMGAESAPDAESAGRNPEHVGVQSTTEKVSQIAPEPSLTVQEPKDARTRAERRTALEDYDRVAIAS